MSRELVETAVSLVTDAERRQIPLRILGSAATAIYAGRIFRSFKDIDVIGRKKDRARIQKLLQANGWRLDSRLLLVSELRELYRHDRDSAMLDVYYDQIDGSHTIRIGADRLMLSFPAITQTDLLLSKLQRHTFRDVDLLDCCALFSIPEFDLDPGRLRGEVSRRWGLWRDVSDNLVALQEECHGSSMRIKDVQKLVGESQKTCSWRLRALIGKRSKWWTEVYDMQTEGKG